MNQHQEQDYYLQLGINIREARKAAGLSQEVLGDQLSLSRASVVNIEKGRHRLMVHTLAQLAQALKVELAELLPDKKTAEGADKIVAASANIITDQDKIDPQTRQAVDKFVSFLNRN